MKSALCFVIFLAATIVSPLATPAISDAQNVEWTGGSNDWFNLFGWNTNQVPGPTNNAIVNNGGTAIANFGSPFNSTGSKIDLAGLSIDFGGGGAAEFNDLDLNVGGQIFVGTLSANNTQGTLITTSGANAGGNVTVGSNFSIGMGQGSASGSVIGIAEIGGNLTGVPTGRLQVGQMTLAGGSVSGELLVAGNVSDFGLINFGYGSIASLGQADSIVTINGTTKAGGSSSASLNMGYSTGGADTSALVTFGQGVSGFKVVRVGVISPTSNANGSAFSNVEIKAGGLDSLGAGSLLAVGLTESAGNAIGELDVIGGISGYSNVQIGVTGLNSSGLAQGTLTLDGNLTAYQTSNIEELAFGKSDGAGTILSNANISGDVSGFDYVYVGGTTLNGTGPVFASVQIGGQLDAGNVSNTYLGVGTSASPSHATGSLTVMNGINGFLNLFVGTGGGSNGIPSTANGTLIANGGIQYSGVGNSNFLIGTSNTDIDAIGDAQVNGGISGYHNFRVGEQFNTFGQVTGDADGTVDLLGNATGSFAAGSRFAVGRQAAGSVATGHVLISGSVSGFENIDIGTNLTGSTGNATGTLLLGGNLQAIGNATIEELAVGKVSGAGNVTGNLNVGGDVTGFDYVYVGGTSLDGTGDSVGNTYVGGQLIAGDLSNSFLGVGTSASISNATGLLEVANGVDGFFNLFVGSGGGSNGNNSSADGTLLVTNGGIQYSGTGSSSLSVGTSNSDVNVIGAANVVGDINGYRNVLIGEQIDTFGSVIGNADGTLFLTGSIAGTSETGSRFSIGRQNASSIAIGTAIISGNISSYESVEIGVNTAGSIGNATGILNLGGDLNSISQGGGQLVVGGAFGLRAASGNVTASNVTGFSTVSIGVSGPGTHPLGSAFGSLNASSIDTGGVGIHTGSLLRIGVANGDAPVVGDVIANGINGFDLVELGGTAMGTSATAYGSLLLQGDSSVGDFVIAKQEGGLATALLTLDDAVLDIAGTMQLGNGSKLIFELDDDETSTAIFAGVGILDGGLDISFANGLSVGVYQYDLITSGSQFGLLGDFDLVSLGGISPDYWNVGIVTDSYNGNMVEIYRLTVTMVPEPGSSLFLFFAATAVIMRRRRSA